MLSARFHALRDRTLAAVDQTLAEPVRLSFLKDGAVDPARAAVEIEALLRVGGGKETSVSGGRDRDWRTNIVAQKAELHVDRAKYPDITCRPGDRVKALARPGQPWFEVLAVEDRGSSRYVLQLGEV